jgi:addiction module HigA family antidote
MPLDASDDEDVSDDMSAPPHPADFLNEVLMPATGRSDGEVARLLGISLQGFYTILTREKPISPATAAMLGRLFNTGEQFWLKMQADYDRFTAPQNVIDARIAPTDVPGRPAAVSQSMSPRRLPKPVPGSFPMPSDLSTNDFTAADRASRSRLGEGHGRSIV